MAITKKAKDNACLGLYKAVCKYVRLRGGQVIVCNGIDVQEWPSIRKGSFTIAVKCFGAKPIFVKQEAPHE